MKKITLGAILIFLATLSILAGSNIFFSAQDALVSNAPSNASRIPIALKDINPPGIDLSALRFAATRESMSGMTREEVKRHMAQDDCYLIINNHIYNVSGYLSQHPGGRGIILSRCGQEVTGIFASIHSNRAWDLLAKYRIGDVATQRAKHQTPEILKALDQALKKANPEAEVIKVRPKSDYYVAKILFKGKLYEVHIDQKGSIFKEEIENEEADWALWENDKDDK